MTSNRLYVPVYALTLLLSAFLLFLVQPMFGKMILPLLGGSPSVWNTAMLFFQAMLLAGYAYAHGTSRVMGVRTQAILHVALLVLFLFVLPIAVPDGWNPPVDSDPTLWQLGLMAVAVGGPFFVLSGSAPLLQHWFAHTRHEDAANPYFLYAASNLGSMTALLAYPFLVEPALSTGAQAGAWAWGYGLLIVFVLAAALLAWNHTAPQDDAAPGAAGNEEITWQRRGLWLVLAFVPSSLMLGVTTFITTDLATVPLLWIVPLALYVGTFIIAFARTPLFTLERTYYVQGVLLVIILSFLGAMAFMTKLVLIFAHLLLFFFTALMCHQQLAASRPTARHLTQFYLVMSLGGALGGFFNAILAPNLFVIPLEYAIVLALGVFIRDWINPEKSAKASWHRFRQTLQERESGYLLRSGLLYILLVAAGVLFSITSKSGAFHTFLLFTFLTCLTMAMDKRWIFGISCAMILFFHPPGFFWGNSIFDEVVYRSRNFFGVVRVADAREEGIRTLLHGTTIHGTQALAAKNKKVRLSYYSDISGVTDAFRMADQVMDGPQKVATLGLGAGVVSCYQAEGRSFDFYEIDPAVVEVAENPDLFSYLSGCGSPYKIILGDARLQIANQPDNTYDIIMMDAFSSDSIPVHLLTREAFEIYRAKLKPGGFIIVNTSNRYLAIQPVIAEAGKALNMQGFSKMTRGGRIDNMPYHEAEFMVLADNPDHIAYLKEHNWKPIAPKPNFRQWTDSYSNILALFKLFAPPAEPEIINP